MAKTNTASHACLRATPPSGPRPTQGMSTVGPALTTGSFLMADAPSKRASTGPARAGSG